MFQTGILGNSANFDIIFRTDGINRMQLMETGNTTIDGYTVPYDGHLGLSITPSFFGTTGAGRAPFSLLHLNGEGNSVFGPQDLGYREWMRPGITFTHNADLMYIGPRRNEDSSSDVTDAVIAWSDNDQPGGGVGPDVLRFLFTSSGNGTTAISSNVLSDNDYDGVEIARMTGDAKMGVGPRWTNSVLPKRALDVIHRDDGPQFRLTYNGGSEETDGSHADFQVDEEGYTFIKPELDGERTPLVVGFLDNDEDDPYDPTYLDVGGMTRIRDLDTIPSPECVVLGYSVSDVNTADDEDQILGRVDLPGSSSVYLDGNGEFTSASDCRWRDEASSTVTGETDMASGFDPGYDCYRGKTGVGVKTPENAKFEVLMLNDEGGAFNDPIRNDEVLIGTYSRASAFVSGNQFVSGVMGVGDADGNIGTAQASIGVRGLGLDSRYVCGVFGEARGTLSGTGNSFGVRGEASGAQNANCAIYGEVFNSLHSSGYFVGGNVVMSGSSLILSDESIKTDIQDIGDASEILSQLNPKSYYMQSPENRPVAFEEDLQFGLIAQEVQEVLPNLVHETINPEMTDTSGIFVEGTDATLLGVQYEALIPILIAGFKEQNALVGEQAQIMADQEETIEDLEGEVAALTSSLSELQNSVAQLETMVQQSLQKSEDCCAKVLGGKSPGVINGKQSTLEQNVPNPFDQETRIDFNLATSSKVKLMITNATGQTMELLANGAFSSGKHSVTWNASGYAPGVYYYSLYVDGELLTKKMIKL